MALGWAEYMDIGAVICLGNPKLSGLGTVTPVSARCWFVKRVCGTCCLPNPPNNGILNGWTGAIAPILDESINVI